MLLHKPWAADPNAELTLGSLHTERILVAAVSTRRLLSRYCGKTVNNEQGLKDSEYDQLRQLLRGSPSWALAHYVSVRIYASIYVEDVSQLRCTPLLMCNDSAAICGCMCSGVVWRTGAKQLTSLHALQRSKAIYFKPLIHL